MASTRRQGVQLSFERLEARDVPSGSPWLVESFDRTNAGGLPDDWLSRGTSGLVISGSPQQGVRNSGSLQATGTSADTGRTWLNTELPADSEVSVSVYLDSLVPAYLISRGRNLDTDAPSYYGVSVTRGMQLNLVRVVNGQATILQSLSSSEYISSQWVRMTLTTQGDAIGVELFRMDTGQYLNASGGWQFTPVSALGVRDGTLTGGGRAGVARRASYAGTVTFDNFVTTPITGPAGFTTLVEEIFTRPVPGGLPAGWAQWSSGAGGSQVSTRRSLSGSGGLYLGNSADEVRTWLDTDQPADLNVSSPIYLGSAATAQLIARGQNLNTATPSYYAITVSQGMNLQLVRVVNGQTTVLGTLQSQDWLTNQWVHLTLSLDGDTLRVLAYRNDKGEYLTADGGWQTLPSWAMEVRDTALTAGGRVGVGRAAGKIGDLAFDSFTVTQAIVGPGTPDTPPVIDPAPQDVIPLPPNWTQWSNNGLPGFQLSDPANPNQFVSNGASDRETRAWLNTVQGPDVQADVSIFLDSLVPASIVARGQNLDTDTPSYYAVSVNRGLGVQLLKVVNGNTTVLQTLNSADWFSKEWINVSFVVQGNRLQVQIVRADTGEYLNENGLWQSDVTTAMVDTDGSLTSGGNVGLVRPSSYTGRVLYRDFQVLVAASAPTVDPPTNPPPITTPPDGMPPIDPTPVPTPPPSPPSSGGVTPDVPPPANLPRVPRHYSHIRIAQLAYHGTPFGAIEQNLLRNSVDIVLPNTGYLDQINNISPNTPQFIYTNVSNIYQELITDWLAYADRNGIDREAAFYHVNQATPFKGDSASSRPVSWFWSVHVGSDGNWANKTSFARDRSQSIEFGGVGQSVVLGYTERYRAINFAFKQGARNGWTGVLEYVSAVDAQGNPTAWKAIPFTGEGTAGFTQSGRITFDPPADWKPASINGSDLFYYSRVRTLTDGKAPVADTILGRDYVAAFGTDHGVIPAFDFAADRDGDGYLNDAEYARRTPGFDARFVYESRATYPAYGQNRFATNVANPHFQAWAADYAHRFLQTHPAANGLFLDNSLGKLALDPATIRESLANYAESYATLLAGINRRIAPRWVLANTAGGGVAVDAMSKQGVSLLEEFAIRPLKASYSQFEDVAANLERRLSLSDGKAYVILDSLAYGEESTTDRWKIGTLAYYYLLADPNHTLLMFNGGTEPNTTWTRHWTDAVKYDVGKPLTEWSIFATGKDPADTAKTYKVFEREYDNALVLFKPLSYYRGRSGTIADNTSTTHNLNGSYRPLKADGTLGAAVTRITLRNGEGAILVKV